MLKRIYVDNYKSLVNFEFQAGPINLLLGPNGAGKSALFDAVQLIRNFVGGEGKVTDLFRRESRTRWQSSSFQTFELDITQDSDGYRYELSIEHDKEGTKARVAYERLWLNSEPLLKFESGEVQLYRDNHSMGPTYPFDWSLSAIASIVSRPDNTRLTWFKKRLGNLLVIRPMPSLMVDESAQEVRLPSARLDDYVSWYRQLSQDQGLAIRLTDELREIMSGFEHFKFEAVGEQHRLLKAIFSTEDGKDLIEYRFGELSDGQRMLIALYTLLHAVQGDELRESTILLDEPENFLALPEIQPWLTSLYMLCQENKTQGFLISHHPEFINYLLATPAATWFERESNRPTRIKPITLETEGGLPVSELVARGWL